MLSACANTAARRVPGLVALMKRVFPPAPGDRCLNIGGGRWYHPRWENVDLYADAAFVDRLLDLRTGKGIDLPDGSARLVFCSHVLEHLTDPQALRLLGEVHRLLRPGGLLRLAVPDAERAFAAYRAGDRSYFEQGGVTCRGDSPEQLLCSYFASYRTDGHSGGPPVDPDTVQRELGAREPLAFIEWCVGLIPADAVYRGHVNGYTYQKLARMLAEAGFADVRPSAFRRSAAPVMRGRHFDNRPAVSLYVEARR